MEVHAIDESNIGELLDLHAKSLIKENLTESDQITNWGVGGGGRKSIRMIITPMLIKEIIPF